MEILLFLLLAFSGSFLTASLSVWFLHPKGFATIWHGYCHQAYQILPSSFQKKLAKPLLLTGFKEENVQQWWGQRLLIVGIALVFLVVLPSVLFKSVVLLGVLWSWQGYLSAGQRAKKRQQEAVYALPLLMDGLAMLVGTGAPLIAALSHSVKEMSPHALRQELNILLQNVRLGLRFEEALDVFCQRLPCPEIRLFSNLLLQSSKQGGSLAPLLEQQAQIRREIMTAEIEQLAQESPVKLLFPLAFFIFPATMLPFIGVIYAKIAF